MWKQRRQLNSDALRPSSASVELFQILIWCRGAKVMRNNWLEQYDWVTAMQLHKNCKKWSLCPDSAMLSDPPRPRWNCSKYLSGGRGAKVMRNNWLEQYDWVAAKQLHSKTANYEVSAQKQQCSLTLVVGFNGTAPKTFSGGGGGEKHQK